MLLTVANSLAPVFLLILLGWVLSYTRFLSASSLQGMARLTYWIGVPALLFTKIAETDPSLGQAGDLLLAMVSSTALGMALTYVLARAFGMASTSIGTLIQSVFRGNLAFVGLPVTIYAFSGSAQGDSAVQTALVIFGPMVVLYNICGVLALLLSRDGIESRALTRMGRELLVNPLLLACLAGGLYAYMGWPLPTLAQRSLTAIGQTALPLALICIGGTLVSVRLRGNLSWVIGASLGKVVMMPLLGLGTAWLLNLSAESTRILLILLACPTAAISYVMVRQLGGDEVLASGSILISTVLAALSLAVILACA
ncbi:MAG: AEC family transporter [Gammaproteobacteria bacterium]|nr:AEC family transporter [Gammaproteobacteria bacterium]MCP5425090.1 AEC family transporter [Gammaproteobacteria bacterium]